MILLRRPIQMIRDIQFAVFAAALILTGISPATAQPKTDSAATRPRIIPDKSRPMGQGSTLTGLDKLKAENFEQLKGKRVALLTNASAVDRDGNHLIDLMFGHPNVKLVKLFSPEHGLF